MNATQNPYSVELLTSDYAPGVYWNMEIPSHPAYEFVDMASRKFGRAEGLNFMGKSYSWRQLARASDRVAEGLQDRGLVKGDRVALMLPNSFYYYALYYGILKAGGTVVNINPTYMQDDINYLVENSGAKFIATLDIKPLFAKARNAMAAMPNVEDLIVCPMDYSLPLLKKVGFNVLKRADVDMDAYNCGYRMFYDLMRFKGRYQRVGIDPENDIAVIQYTNGTTSKPKGAMLSHANIIANAYQARAWMPEALEGKGSSLMIIPWFHVFGMMTGVNLSTLMGWTIHAMPQPNIDEALRIIEREKITFLPGVPQLFNAIGNKVAEGRRPYNLTSVEFSISGGAALKPETKRNVEGILGVMIREGLGMSEASPVITCQPSHRPGTAGDVGLVMPRTQLKVVSVDDATQHMPVGEMGEIYVKGPQVFKGYWKNPAATAEVLNDGWLKTGDAGHLLPDGTLVYDERLGDIIKVMGFKIPPSKIEELILSTGKVEECIVFGVEDANAGESPIALVYPKKGANISMAELNKLIRENLTRNYWPREIYITDAPLPKTAGVPKPSKKEAKRLYFAGEYARFAAPREKPPVPKSA